MWTFNQCQEQYFVSGMLLDFLQISSILSAVVGMNLRIPLLVNLSTGPYRTWPTQLGARNIFGVTESFET